MPFTVSIDEVRANFPEYKIIGPLTPSEQKAAFQVVDKDGNELCLKIIAPSHSMDRLYREILAMQSISHPNIVRLKEYTFSSTGQQLRHYIIEEFVPGQDLSGKLGDGIIWPLPSVCDFFSRLSDGLTALENVNVVHRDLKPSNIRVRPNGSPVIIDFGLARHLEMPDLTNTSSGAAIGTPIYFAPEQFLGTKHDIDHRTDIFALGIIMYQALVGKHPFYLPRMTRKQLSDIVCGSIAHVSADGFRALPQNLQVLLGRLLEKERGKRPNSAFQVAAILRKIGGAL